MNNMKKLVLIGLLALWSPFLLADIPINTGIDIGDVGDEPLSADEAFALSTKAVGADMIRAEWAIADGYYLYKNKFKFTSNTPSIKLGDAVYPKGKIKQDEFFGKVETYRHKVSIDIPIIRSGNASDLDLKIVSQGCADIGICYPPKKVPVKISLPPTAAMSASTPTETSSLNPIAALKSLGKSLGLTTDEEFLRPDQAFVFSADVENANTIRASWDIEKGYYLYRDKFKFELQDANGITIGDIKMPPGEEKIDESFGKMVVYHDEVEILIPLVRTNLDPTKLTLIAKYQGCAEKGFCYPPQKKSMPLLMPKAFAATDSAKTASDSSSTTSPADSGSVKAGEAEDGSDRSFIGNLLFAFGIGVLLTFTPCVLPMIPILVGVIVGQSGKQPTKMRAGMLSGSYVMGTAVTYSLAGWLAGASGAQLQAYTQNPWGLGIVAGILVVLSLSMFGFYEIQMPSFIQSKLQMKSQNVKGGSMFGTFFLGLVSALIVGACVTPLLMLVLGIAIQSGDPVLGASMMFAMSMGMGVFLVMVGVGAGHLLPKAGTWMDVIKYVFGVLLIGVAIYLLTPLQGVPILLLWATFFIVVGIYMGATQAVPEGASKWMYLWKGLGTVLFIWGILALIGGMKGNRDIMEPIDLSSIGGGGQVAMMQGAVVDAHDLFIQVKNNDELDAELAKAKAAGKAVLLDYYATWCTDCRRMEKATFSNPQVQQILRSRFVMLQVDVTDPDNEPTEAIKKRYKVFGPPAMLFFDRNGNMHKDFNFYGFKKPEDFIETVNRFDN